MKKIFTLIAAALMAVGASAQTTYFDYTVSNTATAAVGTVTIGSPAKVESSTIATGGYAYKSDGDLGSGKYIKGTLADAAKFQAGDVITVSFYTGSTPTGSDYGVVLSADNSSAVTTLYSSAKNTVETKSYTVTATDAFVGGTDIYVARAAGKSTYIVSIKVTGGEREAEIPAEPTDATTWNFAVTSDADSTALAALVDGRTWTYTKEGSRFQYNVEVAANKFVDLGEIGFRGGAGIQVGRNGGKLTAGSAIRVDVNNRVQLNCSNGQFRLPDLAKNDVVKIRYASGSGTEARTFTVTNGTPATLNATVTPDAADPSKGTADVIEAEVTVTADGDLTLLQSKAINVYAIAINTKLPEVPSDEPSDPTGINTVAADAAQAGAVKKYVDGKQVVIEKNGKKYNVAGALIK